MTNIIKEERIGGQRLILGDCLKVMPELGKFDAVVTSPPYDDIRDYGDGFDGVDCLKVISNLSSHLSNGGVIMWNVADGTVNGSETGTSFKQALHAIECGLRLHDTMIYIKEIVSFPESVRYFSGHEYMFIFSNGAPKTFNPIKDRPNKWAGTSIHGTERQTDGSLKGITGAGKIIKPFGMRFNWWKLTNASNKTGHPAVMPPRMAYDQIQSWSNYGETILDPFLGSGTTLLECQRLGRSGTGIELDPDYFDIACKRVDEASRQVDLFIEPPKQTAPVQTDLLAGSDT